MASQQFAKLIYCPDDRPGISRRRCGRGFSYYMPDGSLIRDRAERAGIAAIAVSPAYVSVWITPEPQGHLQATGRDAKGRKQYRYHPDWAAQRAQRKYDGLAAFGRTLPRLRARIATGLCAPEGWRDLALAAVLALLDRASLRIGNEDYARENGSYGATTLLGEHARFNGSGVTLDFPGKAGQPGKRPLAQPATAACAAQGPGPCRSRTDRLGGRGWRYPSATLGGGEHGPGGHLR